MKTEIVPYFLKNTSILTMVSGLIKKYLPIFKMILRGNVNFYSYSDSFTNNITNVSPQSKAVVFIDTLHHIHVFFLVCGVIGQVQQ